jgi:3-oxoacyl-[acyl-carrier protein] reductase
MPARLALVTGSSGAIGSAIARSLAAQGLHVIAHANRNAESVERLCEQIRAAGGSAASMSHQKWSRVIRVNLDGFFNVTQPALLPMIRSRNGRIVNVSSVAAIRGNPGQVNYAAAKAGLIGATRALALEVATRGITVNAVAPGIIESDMTADTFSDERIRQLVPMGRAGVPEDVAACVAFLCSESARYITGQVIAIDGGLT